MPAKLLLGRRLKLKAVAIYRDGCKRPQPLNAGNNSPVQLEHRRKLEDTRDARNHRFEIGGTEGYVSVGLFPDGAPGEVFLTVSKQGSTVAGLLDFAATLLSYALPYGVPLRFLVKKFSHMRFEPSGFTRNKKIPNAKSIPDYLVRWLASEFLPVQDKIDIGIVQPEVPAQIAPPKLGVTAADFINQADAPPCPDCGSIMVRNGTCYRCLNCGTTSGCS